MKKLFYILFFTIFCVSTVFASTGDKLAQAALLRIKENIIYDPTYFKIPFPNGDIPKDRGVCTDVVIRSYRTLGIDLQKLVNEDMKKNFDIYPKLWGLKRVDSNIDHRRVPNLKVFFARHGRVLAITKNPADYKVGDIVTWNLRHKGSLPHIGIVVTKPSVDSKVPMVVHNIGQGPKCEDILFSYKITGHYSFLPSLR